MALPRLAQMRCALRLPRLLAQVAILSLIYSVAKVIETSVTSYGTPHALC